MILGMPVAIYGTICQLRELNGVSIRTDNGNILDVPCGCLRKLVAEQEVAEEDKPVYDLPFHDAVRLMSEGYVLEREFRNLIYRINDGFIEIVDSKGWMASLFSENDLNSKWRVIAGYKLTESK